MFNNVLILSASAGAGHVRAAQALEKAFADAGAARRVAHVDTLQYTNKLFRHFYSKAYLDLVNKAPEVLGWLYDHLDKPWKFERRRLALDKLNAGPFVRMLKQERPDIAVCTHFLPAEIIAHLKKKNRLTCPLAVVVTDLDVHAMWLTRGCDHYFVAMEETKVHLCAMGVLPGAVSVTGIPIDPVFAQPMDKAEARRKLGLELDRVTILLSAGGFGVGPVDHLMSTLTHLEHRAQVVAICGKNEKLKATLQKFATPPAPGSPAPGRAPAPGSAGAAANVAIHVVGFTTQMDEYMSAADILLGKPGGLTTSEALAKGLVMVIVNPIPGQEERNADHLLEEGAAIRCNNLPALAYKIDRLLADPAKLAAMRAAALRLSHPHAARDIVDTLLRLQEEKRFDP